MDKKFILFQTMSPAGDTGDIENEMELVEVDAKALVTRLQKNGIEVRYERPQESTVAYRYEILVAMADLVKFTISKLEK